MTELTKKTIKHELVRHRKGTKGSFVAGFPEIEAYFAHFALETKAEAVVCVGDKSWTARPG